MYIPNNIDLDPHSALVRQLTSYQVRFLQWWRLRGPSEFHDREMNLRMPTGGVKGSEWTRYHRMRPSDYRWGVFMMPPDRNTVVFGERKGQVAWTCVPEEYRDLLLDHVTVQGDVENAAVEQSHELTQMVPSAIDLEHLFQFFLEEGRHTWAMSHLLIEYFGSDGADAAEGLLQRMSGDAQNPRLLDAFNYHTEDWLSHFMWCFFADRVGKYQIQAVTQSAFLPLARTARFMMFEEPLHIKFGMDGLERVLYRSAEITLREDTHAIFDAGAIPLPVFQKYLNYWLPKIFDLFGHDISERSRVLYQAGIRSPRNFDKLEGTEVAVDVRCEDRLVSSTAPAELAINAVMRRQYIAEVGAIIGRWNQQLRRLGLAFELQLPHERFHRDFGPCKGLAFDLDGNPVHDADGQRLAALLPTPQDLAGVRGLMGRELGEGRTAAWLAPAGASLDKLMPA
ncbi:putative boxb like benzoyl-coa oxygenase component;albicidin synthetase protein [Xanthomonas albilineans GPE PC73]|uniref:Putative boxb like benzoyl-coa oxygenase componentalbicidin synthetase protein n=4 Tax=Xanthomonas albilineans TaxID=29447 RepID=D2UAJ9_XANAP|nr:putative boxb like benzoyl-coa oxygenase component albicidin synthetase protein [Xanthomonas albilineans]CBA16021.1 putative boxb like benzoyl-coa oxygenase component;albicidin synthetase protein [Xanthomonas albilineans GPE PC73]